jgi:hypothetical protein
MTRRISWEFGLGENLQYASRIGKSLGQHRLVETAQNRHPVFAHDAAQQRQNAFS